MPKQHFWPLVSHLGGEPKQVAAAADVGGGEGVAGLVEVAVANAGPLEGVEPGFLPDGVGPGPGLVELGVVKDILPPHEGEALLAGQRRQRLAGQFDGASPGPGLGGLDDSNHFGARYLHGVTDPVDGLPAKGAQLGRPHPGCEREGEQVGPLLIDAVGCREDGGHFLRGEGVNVLGSLFGN